MKSNYPFAAVLFDMDGTLLDNVPLLQLVWREFNRLHGLRLSEEELDFARGRTAAEVVVHWYGATSREDIHRLTEEIHEMYRQRLATTDVVRLVPGVVEFLSGLKKLGVSRVLATNAPPANVEAHFNRFGLSPYFDAIVTADDVPHGKPDPEIYRVAAQRAGAKVEHCLVGEDSAAGVAAAKAAGCICLGLTITQSQADLTQEGVDFVASDYTNLPMALAIPG